MFIGPMLKRLIDEVHMQYPFMGTRSIRDQLQNKGYKINRKRVQRLMREMGISSLAPKPNTNRLGKKNHEALNEALSTYGVPEIFNTDQGAQFTSEEFTTVLKSSSIKISMDGKSRWMDNVFIERLWRSLKYEEVYLKAYETVPESRTGVKEWIRFYTQERTHQTLDWQTPEQVYFGNSTRDLAA